MIGMRGITVIGLYVLNWNLEQHHSYGPPFFQGVSWGHMLSCSVLLHLKGDG